MSDLSRSSYLVAVMAVALAAVAGCSSGADVPPLVITQDTAVSAAAEVLVTIGSVGAAFSVPPDPGKTVSGVLPASPVHCRVAGTTFWSYLPWHMVDDHCDDGLGRVTDGTLDYVIDQSPSSAAPRFELAVAVDRSITANGVTAAASADYGVVFDETDPDKTTFDLTADHLQLDIARGDQRDTLTLSTVSAHADSAANGPTTTNQRLESYEVASRRANSYVSVRTLGAVTWVTDGAPRHPNAGTLRLSNTNRTTLLVSILGDERYVPAGDEGQIALALFDANGDSITTLATTWAALEAAAAL